MRRSASPSPATISPPRWARAPRDVLGKPWSEIAAALSLDPEGRVAKAIASRDTWSGVTIAWPSRSTGDAVTVELSGLPIFDRDRDFLGYRGFGVCRDVARAPRGADAPSVEPQRRAAPERAAPEAPAPEAPEPRPLLTVVPAAKNVVPFRAAPAEKRPALTPVEHSAFHEIAETLARAPPAAPPSRARSRRARTRAGAAARRHIRSAAERLCAQRRQRRRGTTRIRPPFSSACRSAC